MAAWWSQGGVQRRRDAQLNHRSLGRQAALGIFKGLVEEQGVFTVQVDGTLMVSLWLVPGGIGGRLEVWQPVHSHVDLGNRRVGVQLGDSLHKGTRKPLLWCQL